MRHLGVILACLGASGCGERVPGASLALSAKVAPLDASTRDLDGRTLAGGWLTLSLVEAVPCPTFAQRVRNEFAPVGSAWAHGVASPTKLATPHVLSLTGGSTVSLGELEPAAGRWCALHVAVAPADADAEGVESTPMVGQTLRLELDDGSVIERRDSTSFDLALGPLVFDASHLHAAATVELSAAAWFSSVHAKTIDLATSAPPLFAIAVH